MSFSFINLSSLSSTLIYLFSYRSTYSFPSMLTWSIGSNHWSCLLGVLETWLRPYLRWKTLKTPR
jgi:hypothetical protein